MDTDVCANPDCTNSMEGKRPQAETCNPICGRELRRLREWARRAEPFWAGFPRIRLEGRTRPTEPGQVPRNSLKIGPYVGLSA